MLSLTTIPSLFLSHHQTILPYDVVISECDVQIDMGSLVCPDAVTNIYRGVYSGQPARFREKRQLSCYSRAGVAVTSLLIDEAVMRRQHQTLRHVPDAGVYQTSASLGRRTFLVEAPYHYVDLGDYLATNLDASRQSLIKEALEILADLHSKGLVNGIITMKSFVVDLSGGLHLSNFENIRFEYPPMPFRPIPGLASPAMAHTALELLQSPRDDGNAGPTRASDMYSFGCFAYEVSPLAPMYTGYAPHVARTRLITAVVNHGERPERPAVGSDAYTRFGLTDVVWALVEECFAPNPAARPSALDLMSRLV